MAAPMAKNQSTKSTDVCWLLQGYARFVPKGNQGDNGSDKIHDNVSGKWKYFAPNADGLLSLSVKDGFQLVVCRGSAVLESQFLRNPLASFKAYTKTDSILFVHKVKNETRRFRVKFEREDGQSAEERCSECVKELSGFLLIKDVNEDNTENKSGSSTSRKQLSGEVSLSEISKVLTHDLPADLPAAYHHSSTQVSPEDLRTLVRLCLTDSAFPAFVESVEKELKELTSDE